MSKQLYEEALADVKKIKEIAEDNAKRAVVEAVAPRIRELIEKELLGENAAGEQAEKAPEEADKDNKILTDENPSADPVSPDAPKEAKLEGVFFLSDLKKNVRTERKFTEQLESIENLLVSKNSSQISEAKLKEVAQSLDALYKSVKQNVDSPAQRLSYNLKINNCLKKVEKLQENKNMKNRKSRLDEAEIMLKLTGVPDELEDELDGLGVELIAGEEAEGEEPEGEESEDAELDLGDEEDAEGGEDAGDLLDAPADDEEEEVEEMSVPEAYGESRRLSDNVIVEIDEGMLRREIAKMRALREADETKPQSWGHGPGDVSDEFADEEMDVLDVELTTENDAPLGEEDVKPGLDQKDEDPNVKPEGAKCESLRRQMANELKLQESYKAKASRAARLYENAQAQFNKAKTLAERKNVNTVATQYKAAYTNFAKRYNESVKRFNKLSQDLAEASRPQRTRSNNVARPAASSGDSQLRNKLAETNLLNAKLMFTNKLLQSEALTARQKSQVIEQLDEAKTLREVKLVYESLAKTLATPRKTVTEGRVLGSSSQATRSASAQTLNEGFEAERWAKLAGIAK